MSRLLIILFTLAATTLTMQAQEPNAAFYIYQNDGHFDGFFYDEVQKISYSTLDTLGIEHDEYVSQEIVTADSTYRIMLTAIDSVGFQQPEIRYNPKVRFMRDEGMMPYLTAADGLMLTFSTDMPAELRPAIDDVLVCPDIDGELTTFVGIVVTTYEFEGTLRVHCKLIEKPSDVYEQFITVEEVQTNEATGEVRRRIAGAQPYRAEGNWTDVPLFKFNVDFEHDWQLSPHWNLVTNVHAGFGASASLAYKFTLSEFYIKGSLKAFIEFGLKTGLDGHIEDEFNVTNIPILSTVAKRFTRIPFPVNMPIMYANVTPQPFIRGEAHFNVSLTTGVRVQPFRISFEILDHKPWVSAGIFNEPGEKLKGDFDFKAEISGMVQLGMKFPLEIGLEDWFSKVYEATISETVYAGPQVSGNFTLASAAEGRKDNFYEAFKDMTIELSRFSLYNEIKSTTIPHLWKGQKHEFKFTRSASLDGLTMKLFPEIKDFKTEITGELNNNLTAKIGYIRGDVFLPQQIGVALYDKNDHVYKSAFRDETYSIINTFNDATVQIKDIEPGVYKIRPVIRFLGSNALTPIYKFEETFALGAPTIVLKPRTIDIEEEGGEKKVEILSTSTVTPDCYADAEWIHPEVDAQSFMLTVRADENPTMKFRKGVVYVSQVLEDGATISDSLVVKQYGGITLSKSQLDFDVEGGQEILDVRTMLTGVQVNVKGGGDWLHADLGGETLTITATKNTEGKRSAVITLAAFNKAGDGIVTTNLTVTQKTLLDIAVDTIYLDRMEDEKTISVTTSLPTLIVEEEASWLQVGSYGNTSFWVSAKRNYRAPRKTAIEVTATDGEQYATKRIVVVQDGEEQDKDVWPYIRTYMNSIEIPSEGGNVDIEVRTNMADIDIIYEDDDWEWLNVTYNPEEETCTFYADRNMTGKERKCHLRLSAKFGDHEDHENITVTQKPFINTVEYDGCAVTLRWGGDARADMMSLDGVSSFTYPCGIGVYGYSSPGVDGATFYSSGSDDYYGSWHINFSTIGGLMYGSFHWSQNNGQEGVSFSISGAPVGQSGPINPFGAYRGDPYWIGDAAFCYPNVGTWGYTHPDGNNYVGGFDYWYPIRDTETGEIVGTHHSTYNNPPVEIDVFLRLKDHGGYLPFGHPDRN